MHAALQAATSLRFCSRFSRPYLSQIPAGVARERPRKRESAGSSLIIHHRVQPGETKMAALLVSSPSANTLSSKEDSPLRELSRSRPPRSGLTTTLFARPLSFLFFFFLFLFFSLRFETRRPCLADTDEDYQFSSVDDSKDSRGKEEEREKEKEIDTRDLDR